MSENYKFFSHKNCEFFPCHKGVDEEDFNCLFCYCPLYFKDEECGGNYIILENGVKDCTGCTYPHEKENYDAIIKRIAST